MVALAGVQWVYRAMSKALEGSCSGASAADEALMQRIYSLMIKQHAAAMAVTILSARTVSSKSDKEQSNLFPPS